MFFLVDDAEDGVVEAEELVEAVVFYERGSHAVDLWLLGGGLLGYGFY